MLGLVRGLHSGVYCKKEGRNDSSTEMDADAQFQVSL